MCSKVAYCIQDMFSLASRKRCMSKMKLIATVKPGIYNAVNNAVLLPLCLVDNVPSILYSVKCADTRSRTEQISFAGAKVETDETIVQAALRGTEEQIGLEPNKINVWGEGPRLWDHNHSVITTPVIGSLNNLSAKDFNIKSNKVTECFAVPVQSLCDPNNQYHTRFKNGFILPIFVAENYKIWGMTAYITHMFLNSTLNKAVYKNEWMKKKMVEDHGPSQ